MREITHWHRTAELFLTEKLELAEIVKLFIIITETRLLNKNTTAPRLGINVFDNSELENHLLLGVLATLEDAPVSYADLGKILSIHPNTVATFIKRLMEDNIISKDEQTPIGSRYRIIQPLEQPIWMAEFTRALTELYVDPDLKARTAKECDSIEFQRGMQVVRRELRERFKQKKTE